MWPAAANHLTEPTCAATCDGNWAWLVSTSSRPTAQALLVRSMSLTSSIMSLLLVMLCALIWASMACLTAVLSPKATSPGSRKAIVMLLPWWRVGPASGLRAVASASGRLVARADGHEPLAAVLLDRAAVLAGQPFELDDVEAAAGDDEPGLIRARPGSSPR